MVYAHGKKTSYIRHTPTLIKSASPAIFIYSFLILSYFCIEILLDIKSSSASAIRVEDINITTPVDATLNIFAKKISILFPFLHEHGGSPRS